MPDTEKSVGKLADFLGVEINLLPLDVNSSEKGYTVEGNAIRSGFVAVKGIPDEVIDQILAKRESDGVFDALEDFQTRVGDVDGQVIDNLIRGGAFDAISGT